MINNIEELKEYKKNDSKQYQGDDIFIKRCAIFRSGINHDQLNALLKTLPFLPKSYTNCLTAYNIFQVCIGYFSISPINYDVDNIVDSLIMAQDPEHSFLPRSILDPLDLYWIGNNNNDTIYVAGKNSPKYQEGEIVDINEFILDAEEKDYDDYMMPMAKDFEQFLILAGNLNEVHREFKDGKGAKTEMERRLHILNVDKKYHDSWFSYIY
ncbi:MAG: hypothetical protein HEEMFOPI_01760 [Holosporales bacterium]